MHALFFYFYARILMAAKSFKEGGARLAETILQRGAARQLCISVCQSRKIHRLVLTGRHYCKKFFCTALIYYIIPMFHTTILDFYRVYHIRECGFLGMLFMVILPVEICENSLLHTKLNIRTK